MTMRRLMILGLLLACAPAFAGAQVEESIRGTLEKTARPGACAQITDVLKETYFIAHSAEAQKMCAGLYGKKVMVVGVVDVRPGTEDYYFKLTKLVPQDGVSRTAQDSTPENSGSSGLKVPLPPPTEEPAPQKPGEKPEKAGQEEAKRPESDQRLPAEEPAETP